MAYTHNFSFSFSVIILSILFLAHGSLEAQESKRGENVCRFEHIEAVEPERRVESEAGVTEYWNERQQQFRCAGVAATRHTVQPRGLLLPQYSNAPRLIYLIQGKAISGIVLPGCPESFQSFQKSERHGREQHHHQQSADDQHQKVRRIQQGDIVAVPAGVLHWFYNDGETPVVAVTVLHTSNFANQLDQNPRKFYLAGNQPREGWLQEGESKGNNVLAGFDVELLVEAVGISRETAEKLRGRDDKRGSIVRVEHGLRVVRPERREEEEEEREEKRERGEEEERERRRERGEEEKERRGERGNGVEEGFCNLRLKENIEDPSRADVYNPHAGRITSVNGQKLPVLKYLQLSAERGALKRNALLAPHWTLNAHTIIYALHGHARLQIVDDNGNSIFNGDLRRGNLIVVPQNYAVVKKASGDEEFEWVAFKTSENAIVSPIFGRSSAIRGIPADVLANSYQIRREEARRVKENRGEELRVLEPRESTTQGRSFF